MSSRIFLLPVALLALLAAAGVLSWWVVAPSAQAADIWTSAAEVSIEGTVTGSPEDVAFSGLARIRTRLALDPDDSRRSKILLQFDLSRVTGKGVSTAATYVIEESREAVHRVLRVSDVIQVTFPFHASGKRAIDSSRNGIASFALSIDTTTGGLTAAKASISSPDFGVKNQ